MIAYFDCNSGISGDMLLGAIVDAGLSIDDLRKELLKIPVKGYELKARKVRRGGLRATKVDVEIKESRGGRQEFRKWKDVRAILDRSSLAPEIKKKGKDVFKKLFEAEASVHGSRYDRIHLHELGALDCIIDILGTIIGLDLLGIKTVYASPINLGGGTVKTEHGLLPVPVPATVELLQDMTVYSSGPSRELTTPTGAVLISSFSSRSVGLPEMVLSKTGTGAGYRDFKEQPNVLRLLIGEAVKGGMRPSKHSGQPGGGQSEDESVTVIETNIDDMNPQIYDYLTDRLFKAGALDVFLTQVIMKKGRPGIKLTVLSADDKRDALSEIIFEETTTIGIRLYRAERKVLAREIQSRNTKYGKVNIKVAALDKSRKKFSVEYEDCKKLAKKFRIPLHEVMKIVSR